MEQGCGLAHPERTRGEQNNDSQTAVGRPKTAGFGGRTIPRPVCRPGGERREVRHSGRPTNVIQETVLLIQETRAFEEVESSTPLVDLSCTGAVWYTEYSYGWLLYLPQQDSSNAPRATPHLRPPPLYSFCAAWVGQFLTGIPARAFAPDLVSGAGDEAFPPTRSRRTGGRGQSVRVSRNGSGIKPALEARANGLKA